MRTAVWRRASPGIYDLRGDDRVSLYKMWNPAPWHLEISGPPLWPLVDYARACRTSCGGIRMHFDTRADAIKGASAYLRIFARPAGDRPLRVISKLDLIYNGPPPGAEQIEADPYDPQCVVVWFGRGAKPDQAGTK